MTNTRNLADIGRIEELSKDNAIINGNFDIWQRGTNFTASGYGPDRWRTILAGSSSTQSQESFTLGQTDVPNNPKYFYRNVVTSSAGAGNGAIVTHRIENVSTFAGQTVTLSFWAKADASKNISTEFVQNFGGGGTPSLTTTGIGVSKLSLTTTWQKFTVTASIPSISGKSLGTDNNDYLAVLFWLDAGSNFDSRTDTLAQQSGTFDIAQVKLETGSVATPFIPRTEAEELFLCQRYYQIIKADTANGTSVSATAGLLKHAHNVLMRTSPSRTLVGTSTLTVDFFGYGTSTTTSVILSGNDEVTTINFNSASPSRAAATPLNLRPTEISLDAEL